MIGYGLEFTEIHLWWLLAYRARLLARRKLSSLGNVYFYAQESPPTSWMSLRDQTLRSLQVDVVYAGDGETSYRVHYEHAITLIGQQAT